MQRVGIDFDNEMSPNLVNNTLHSSAVHLDHAWMQWAAAMKLCAPDKVAGECIIIMCRELASALIMKCHPTYLKTHCTLLFEISNVISVYVKLTVKTNIAVKERKHSPLCVQALNSLWIVMFCFTDLSNQHLKDENPQSPPVHTAGVVIIRQHLWGQKLWCAAECWSTIPMAHT